VNKLNENIIRIQKKNEKEKKVFENISSVLRENTYPSVEQIKIRLDKKKEV
jgi:hypothetical protein